jgi:hypothetical protein
MHPEAQIATAQGRFRLRQHVLPHRGKITPLLVVMILRS